MHRALMVSVVFAVAGVLGACTVVVPSAPDASIAPEDRACGADGECVVVDANCCSCASNGARTSVNGAALARVLDARAACEELCSDALSNDETCFADAVACVDGRCELMRYAPGP